jgi:hypothetical protein
VWDVLLPPFPPPFRYPLLSSSPHPFPFPFPHPPLLKQSGDVTLEKQFEITDARCSALVHFGYKNQHFGALGYYCIFQVSEVKIKYIANM